MRLFVFLLSLFTSPLLVFAQPSVTLSSPAPFQVFQRTGDSGTIVIQGHVEGAGEYIVQASWNGLESGILWQGTDDTFYAEWTNLPVWQDDLVVTIANQDTIIPTVGIGDIYVVAGQSNAVGFGMHNQIYTNTLGLRAAMFTKNGWQELEDPTGIVNDSFAGGSIWPLLATFILESGVPVAFIPAAVGGTRIHTWQPGKPRFEAITKLLDQLPAPYARALLWQQGEGDTRTRAKDYSAYISAIADELYAGYGIPVFAALLFNNKNVNAGIELAIQGDSSVFAGADLRYLRPDNIHYISDINLRAEAWLWWEALVDAGFYEG